MKHRIITQPEAVIFDLGKVLLDFDYQIAARKLTAQSRVPISDLWQPLGGPELLYQYETSRIPTEQFCAEVRRLTGFSGTDDEFAEIFANIFTPIEPMVALHRALRNQGTPTYIFSNTNPLAIEHIRKVYPFFADFDGYVLSYEHGVMKPDARLYEIVEQTTGKNGAALLYLDDREENVRAGAQRGWLAVHHVEPEQTRKQLVKIGLLS